MNLTLDEMARIERAVIEQGVEAGLAVEREIAATETTARGHTVTTITAADGRPLELVTKVNSAGELIITLYDLTDAVRRGDANYRTLGVFELTAQDLRKG